MVIVFVNVFSLIEMKWFESMTCHNIGDRISLVDVVLCELH